MKKMIVLALISILPFGCASYISPIDKAIINAGCDNTIALATKAEHDPNCSMEKLDLMKHYAERAKYLKNWANGGGFPLDALDFAK